MITNRKDGRKSCEDMMHWEKAREIVKEIIREPDRHPYQVKTIALAISEAEKKVRKESEKEIKTLNGVINDMLASDEEIYCRGWNEAIEEVSIVVEKSITHGIWEDVRTLKDLISGSINKLKRR